MGNQSASRLGGDDYQHLYCWYVILELLKQDSPYSHAVVEHPDAGSADDLTLHPYDRAQTPPRYIQVKWHVDRREQYGIDTLLDSTRGRPLLVKLFESWKLLADEGPVEVALVSNWNPTPLLGSLIRDRTSSLSDEFYEAGRGSGVGKVRQRMIDLLDAPEEKTRAFLRSLRWDIGHWSWPRLETVLDDRMRSFGLRDGPAVRGLLLSEVRRRIQDGGAAKRFDQETITEIIERLKLSREVSHEPKVVLWIHGWTTDSFSGSPTVELDWTPLFERSHRRIATPDEWRERLLPDLRRVRQEFQERDSGHFIDFRGRLPLTACIAIGFSFPRVAGFSFRTVQMTGGRLEMWRSDSVPTDASLKVVAEGGGEGLDVVVGFGISGSAGRDVERLFSSLAADAWVYAEPESGTGQEAVSEGADAVAIASSGKRTILWAKRKYRATRIHLVFYGPASLALFLGQALNAVGEIVTYERTATGSYQKSAVLLTG